MLKQYQQGDVVLTLVDEGYLTERTYSNKDKTLAHYIKELKAQWKYARSKILAKSDTTGNTHRVIGKHVRVYRHYSTLYIQAGETAIVEHGPNGPHKPVYLPKGLYKVGIVNEFDHFSNIARKVVD